MADPTPVLSQIAADLAAVKDRLDALDGGASLIEWVPLVVGVMSTLAALAVARASRHSAREVARMNGKVAVIAAERRDWMERLRTCVVDYLACCGRIVAVRGDKNHERDDLVACVNDLIAKQAYIHLMLDTANPLHHKAILSMKVMTRTVSRGRFADMRLHRKARKRFMDRMGAVLDEAWRRVKELE